MSKVHIRYSTPLQCVARGTEIVRVTRVQFDEFCLLQKDVAKLLVLMPRFEGLTQHLAQCHGTRHNHFPVIKNGEDAILRISCRLII
jgi:hypothetical protein